MKKILLIFMICALAISVLVPVGAVMAASSSGVGASAGSKYEIYPNPQNVKYGKTTCTIPNKVSLHLSAGLDQATVDRGYQALSEMDILAYTDGSVSGYDVYFGIYGSCDQADLYAKQNISFTASMFDRIDAYLLDISDQAIVVLGKDTNATFYGLTTLKTIFAQVEGYELRTVTIYDWSDCTYRGFIEGYYGVPWTTDERVELMRFGSEFKTNMYIYAPKDDPYHSSNWRGLYTDADLQNLQEQIDAGTATKTRFVWAIHPFMYQVFRRANYSRDLNVLLQKLQQLYDAGVRQFALSADDIAESDTDAELQKDLCNDIVKWLNEKGDCYNLIFVPTGYWYAKPDFDMAAYFAGLMGSGANALDKSVEIMWTGDRVCSTVANGKFAEFSAMTGGRKAFMWMNWPVNDYATTRPLFGKGEVYNAPLNKQGTTDFSGIVANPMQYAEADKISVFATADYCWNVNGFDADKSYRDCFKYIEKGCPDDLYEICQNLTVANKYEGKYFEESAQFVDDIAAFVSAHEQEQSLTAVALTLTAKFRQVISHIDNYFANCQNDKLLVNIQPFVQSLKHLSEVAINYLAMYLNPSATADELIASYNAAQASLKQMDDCKTPVLSAITGNHDMLVVEVANSVLSPFVQTLRECVIEDFGLDLGIYTGIMYKGFNGIYQGSVENIIDGNLETHAWFNGYPSRDAYVRVDLGEEMQIRDIQLYMGKVGGGDTWDSILEYSVDGKHFTEIQAISRQADYILVDLHTAPITARFLRLRDNSSGSTWVAIREIAVNKAQQYVSYGNIQLEPSVTTDVGAMIDGDPETFTWFGINRTAGAYIQLEYASQTEISQISLLMAKTDSPNDYFPGVVLSYSTDGINFTTIGTYSGKEIDVTLDTPVSVVYLRATSTATCSFGIVIREFSAQ